jgi:prolyl oligopeptidase
MLNSVDCLGEKRRFYYSSYEKPKEWIVCKTDQHKLYFHKLGTAQKRDKVILAQTKHRYIGGYVTEDDRYLVISAANSTYGNELYIRI